MGLSCARRTLTLPTIAYSCSGPMRYHSDTFGDPKKAVMCRRNVGFLTSISLLRRSCVGEKSHVGRFRPLMTKLIDDGREPKATLSAGELAGKNASMYFSPKSVETTSKLVHVAHGCPAEAGGGWHAVRSCLSCVQVFRWCVLHGQTFPS